MIDTTLGVLALIAQSQALIRLRARKLEPVVAYRVAVLLGDITDRLVHYRTIHGQLVQEFGASRRATPEEQSLYGDETMFEVTQDNLGAFRVRMRELNAEPVRLELSSIDITALGSEPMTPEDIAALRPLLSSNGHEGSVHG